MYDFSKDAKRVSIPREWLDDMAKLICFSVDDDALRKKVREGFDQYVDRKIERDYYTKYKTAPTEEEREKARQDYLDKKGIPEVFRW